MVDKPMGESGNGLASQVRQLVNSFGKESVDKPKDFFFRLKASIPFRCEMN